MKVVAVIDVFSFGWVEVVFQFSEVLLAELSLALGRKSLPNRVVEAFFMLRINSRARRLRERLAIQIFTGNLWNVASIAWNMLRLDVLSGTADPVLSLQRMIAILQLIDILLLRRRVNMEIGLLVLGLADGNVDIVG